MNMKLCWANKKYSASEDDIASVRTPQQKFRTPG